MWMIRTKAHLGPRKSSPLNVALYSGVTTILGGRYCQSHFTNEEMQVFCNLPRVTQLQVLGIEFGFRSVGL